jgi:hypothetical protein
VKIWLDPTNSVTALTLFVAAAFDMDWHQRAEEMYFQSLSLFIDRGASLDKNDGSGGTDTSQFIGLQQTLFPSTTASKGRPHEIFFSRLERS